MLRSLGGLGDVYKRQVNNAFVNDVLVVASGPENVEVAGFELGPFDALDSEFFPCAYPTATCVGALDTDHSPLDINPFASGIDIWAPGTLLEATSLPGRDGSTIFFGGTSAAAPYITGVATMLKTIDPTLTPNEIETILKTTSASLTAPGAGSCAMRPGTTDCVGFVDVLAAVQSASNVTLSCTGWDEAPNRYDTSGTALNLGEFNLDLGETEAPIVAGNKAIHALASDTDWYSFSVGEGTPDVIYITLGASERFGTLAFRLYALNAFGELSLSLIHI